MNLENTLTIIQQVIIILVIPVIVALTPSVKKLIDVHTTAKQRAIAEAIAKTAVHSVEQQYPQFEGDKKYIVAAQKINDLLGDKLTAKQVDDLIESAVRQMNIALGKATTTPAVPPAETPSAAV